MILQNWNSYIHPWLPHDRNHDWVERYGNYFFDHHKGNCINAAAAFGICVDVLGLENVYCCHNGGHAWVEIGEYIYDVNRAKYDGYAEYYKRPVTKKSTVVPFDKLDRSGNTNAHYKLK